MPADPRSTSDPRTQREELHRLLEEKERRESQCPIAFFRPNTGQKRLYKVIEAAAIVLCLAGNRFGKTHALVAEIIAAALGYRPWLVPNFKLIRGKDGKWRFPPRNSVPREAWVRRADGLPIKNPANILCLTGLSLTRGIGDIIQRKWKELWPPCVEIKPYYGQFGTWQKIILPNGSEIFFGADSQPLVAWEGFNADMAVFDEPVRRQVYTAVKRGLVDRAGRLLWTMTPLGDAKIAWVAKDLVENDRDDVVVVRGSGRENECISQKALDDFLNDPSMTEDERRAREFGELGAVGKRIVTTFDPATAVIPPTDILPGTHCVLVADPHHAKPTVMIWAAQVDRDHFVIYREWPTRDITKARIPADTTEGLAGRIKTLEGKENVVYRICDPQFGRQHNKSLGVRMRSFQEEMSDHSLHFDCRVDNNLERGIQVLRNAFIPDGVTNRTRIQVFNTCRNVINALSLWSYEQRPDGSLVVSEVLKDFADVVRYMCMYRFPAFSSDTCYSYLEEEEDDSE